MKEKISLSHKNRIKVNINGKIWYLTEEQYKNYKVNKYDNNKKS